MHTTVRSESGWVNAYRSLVAVAFLVGCGANGQGVAGEPGAIDEVRDGIQTPFVGIEGGTQFLPFATVLRASSSANFGVIRAAAGSCGVTFISKHTAITAAHCVGGLTSPFEVDQILTTNLTDAALNASFAVSGSAFPNWTQAPHMTGAQGYNKTIMSNCTVTFRCSTGGAEALPTPNCTTSPASGANGTDIALITCPSRTVGTFLAVNTGDPTSGSIIINWFHEVLTLAGVSTDTTTPPPGSQTTTNWFNYGCRDTNVNGCNNHLTSNWHYSNGLQADFLPLQSSSFPFGGANYKISTAAGTGHHATFTDGDPPVCHGTSGSGVFINGTSTLLGPTQTGGAIINGRLCADFLATQGGAANMTFGNAPFTRFLEATSAVQSDR